VAEISALAPTATRIIDQTPSNFTLVGLIHLALPNARVIHAVRDPADISVSFFSKLFAAGQYYTYDLTELGRYYRPYQALMGHWRRVLSRGGVTDIPTIVQAAGPDRCQSTRPACRPRGQIPRTAPREIRTGAYRRGG